MAVNVASGTKYFEPGQGQTSPGISDVLDGDKVQVAGAPTGTGTFTASLVVVPLARNTGTVSAASANGFSLTTRDATVTVNVSSSTVVHERGVASPSVQSGDTVQVVGTQDGTNTVNALLVAIGTRGHGGHVGHGGHGLGHGGP